MSQNTILHLHRERLMRGRVFEWRDGSEKSWLSSTRHNHNRPFRPEAEARPRACFLEAHTSTPRQLSQLACLLLLHHLPRHLHRPSDPLHRALLKSISHATRTSAYHYHYGDPQTIVSKQSIASRFRLRLTISLAALAISTIMATKSATAPGTIGPAG